MTTTPDRIAFAPDEVLYRRVERRGVHSDGSVKHTSLRPQISVFRGSIVGGVEAVPPSPLAKFNGVAALRVGDARGVNVGLMSVVVVDEPVKDIPSHALVALTTNAVPGTELEEDFELARIAVAKAMKVPVPPT